MQSGIKASSELHTAFNDFTSSPNLFALPVTISSESLQPLEAIPFSSNANLSNSLSSLQPHVQPKVPVYLLLRTKPNDTDFTAITYVPSIAPVRSKTLFASTRTTLLRELGIEKFTQNLFCTDAEEILDPRQWADREKSQDGTVDTGLLTREERELQGIKRAEQEERHGTQGRDLMGTAGDAAAGVGGSSTVQKMKVTEDARAALKELADGAGGDGGRLVQLGIDLSTETVCLISSPSSTSPNQISSHIPNNQPSYTFYHYPSTESIVCIYVCPSSSKIKERMLYASARRFVVKIAESEGVVVSKKIEVDSPEDVDEARLEEEVVPKAEEEQASRGFARPKRPGRRG